MESENQKIPGGGAPTIAHATIGHEKRTWPRRGVFDAVRGSEVTGKASVGKKKDVNEWIEMVAAHRSGEERPGGGGGGGGRVVGGGWGSECFAVGQPKFHSRFCVFFYFPLFTKKN